MSQSKAKQILSKCIEEFEARTQVELVLVIEKQSSTYWHFIFALNLFLTEIFWSALLFLDSDFILEYVILESILLNLLTIYFLHYLNGVRFFIPRRWKKSYVESRAQEMFTKNHMYQTEKRSGLLMYYSRVERMGMLIADQGVMDKMKTDELESFRNQFETAMNHRDFAMETSSFIRSFGVHWSRLWPAESSKNELSNEVQGNLV